MARRKQPPKDLTGIRQRGGRGQVRDNTAARTNVTLGYLPDEWLSGHQVEETTRTSYRYC